MTIAADPDRPRYQHDCDACLFLGRVVVCVPPWPTPPIIEADVDPSADLDDWDRRHYDIYACPDSHGLVIARWGDHGDPLHVDPQLVALRPHQFAKLKDEHGRWQPTMSVHGPALEEAVRRARDSSSVPKFW